MAKEASRNHHDRPRVAWLFPSLQQGNYWHPVLQKFTQIYQNTVVYTGVWTGFAPGYEDAFRVEQVGQMKFVDATQPTERYGRGFIYVSPGILKPLFQFKPDIVFVSGFSLWTILTLLFKPIGQWRVVVMYDGSSPTVDYLDSPLRLLLRRLMTTAINGFITNSHAGKKYLTEILGVREPIVFARPYQVPDATALLQRSQEATVTPRAHTAGSPVFLFVGQIIPRKGLHFLLKACKLLHMQGLSFTLWVIGEGVQQAELEAYCQENGLQERVQWLGSVSYGHLGSYFQQADVFILPTLEDIWGMVVLEAMALGKPVLCSQWAGASELVQAGENGYLFDPFHPEAIAEVMRQLIEHPEQIEVMGQNAQERIAPHSPEAAAQFLAQVTGMILQDKATNRSSLISEKIPHAE